MLAHHWYSTRENNFRITNWSGYDGDTWWYFFLPHQFKLKGGVGSYVVVTQLVVLVLKLVTAVKLCCLGGCSFLKTTMEFLIIVKTSTVVIIKRSFKLHRKSCWRYVPVSMFGSLSLGLVIVRISQRLMPVCIQIQSNKLLILDLNPSDHQTTSWLSFHDP